MRRTRSVPSRSLTTGQRKTSNQVLRRWRGQHLAIASLLLKSLRVDRHTSPAQSHRGPDRRREGLHREEPPPWVLDDPLALGLAGKTAASATARPRAIIISAEDPSLPSIRLPGTQRLIGRAATVGWFALRNPRPATDGDVGLRSPSRARHRNPAPRPFSTSISACRDQRTDRQAACGSGQGEST